MKFRLMIREKMAQLSQTNVVWLIEYMCFGYHVLWNKYTKMCTAYFFWIYSYLLLVIHYW